jgi:anti-anti-sigma factor
VKTLERSHHCEKSSTYLRLVQAEYGSLQISKLERSRTLLLYVAAHCVSRRLILDLSNVQHFGAGFVGVLVDTWSVLHQGGRRLVLIGLNPYCDRLIRSFHLDKLFDIDAVPALNRSIASEKKLGFLRTLESDYTGSTC